MVPHFFYAHTNIWYSLLDLVYIPIKSIDIVFKAGDDRVEDIDVIETPCHTDGSVTFFYKSPHGNYLFTGDTIFQWKGKWATFPIAEFGGSKALLKTSLPKLRNLETNIVMSSSFIDDVTAL